MIAPSRQQSALRVAMPAIALALTLGCALSGQALARHVDGELANPVLQAPAERARHDILEVQINSVDALPAEISARATSTPAAASGTLAESQKESGEPLSSPTTKSETFETLTSGWIQPDRFTSTLQFLALTTILSLAPAILLMTTSYIRIHIVLSLLRQALGTQQLPSNQVITSIALFLTVLVMWPVWQRVYDDAIVPYTDSNVEMSFEEAWTLGAKPVRQFMSQQIDMTGNSDDVWMFLEYVPHDMPSEPSYDDVPLRALVPAFILSELKTAFLIGFRIYLPFLILDVVVSSVTISMGMIMLPPPMISLPLKLLLFVLVDGWHLVVQMLLQSFGTFT